MKTLRFIRHLIVWESIMILAIGILTVQTESHDRLQREDVEVFGPILLSGLIVTGLGSFFEGKFRGQWSILIGFGIGIASVVAFGLAWASKVRGFELQPGILTASLMLCIPGGIGGGILGWLNRSKS